MANTRDIRRRIRSIKNTAQITRAMQMVAASKMRKAQQLALAGRPYIDRLLKILQRLQVSLKGGVHPFLETRPVVRELVIVVSPDKGLCGGLNTNLLREAARFDKDTTDFFASGRRGQQWLARNKRSMIADFPLPENLTFADTKKISKMAIDLFLDNKVDRVTVLYTAFVNTLIQKAEPVQLLPIPSLEDVIKSHEDQVGHTAIDDAGLEYKFEPDAQSVLNNILPYSVHTSLYQLVLASRASEHSARMVAMKNATENAKGLIKDLTLEYNKLRQAAITTELLEISTAQMAISR